MKSKKQTTKTIFYIIFTLFIFTTFELFYHFNFFSFLENKSYDFRMSIASRFIYPSEDICFIELDQASLDWASEEMGWAWPWPRSAYGDIVNYFTMANANSLVFDVLFTEPSVYGPEDDQAFAEACEKNGKVIQTIYEDGNTGKSLYPVSPIKEATAGFGVINSAMDDDDIIRRAKLFFNIDGKTFTSLGYEAFLSGFFKDLEEANSQNQDISQLTIDTFSTNFSFLEDDGSVYLRFQSSIDDYLPYRASDILESYYAILRGEEPLIPPENFEDTYTFFAFYAPGLFDICSVPNNQVYPGVGVHITLLDNLLNQQFITKSPWYISLIWILILSVLGTLTVLISEKQKSTKKTMLSIILIPSFIVGVIIGASFGLFILGFWIPLIIPLFAYLFSFFGCFIFSYSQEGKQRRFIKSAFSQYVSPTVIENLIQNPSSLKLGGEKRRLSIFFSDIQGFTSISENIPPEELTEFLNDFLSEMSNIILKYGGTIDKYEGDAIVAFWNAPTNVENHELCALEAALECQNLLENMRATYTYRLGSPVYMRIGLNTGDAVVGNLGSRERFDYTMIGDSVNLAARLEGLNKEFGTYTMCSKNLKEAAEKINPSLLWRELGRVAVVGKKTAVTVYEPLSKAFYSENKNVFDIFDQGRELFYKGNFKEAKELFSSIQEQDNPAAAYVKKCEKLINQFSNDSSLENWKGIWVASSK
ncbi:MAG: CHASE2 domain-containing protein [Treponemataceae bacterium]|nr:CHASE2 domain-containing protein [Treponemataceae bacterium]